MIGARILRDGEWKRVFDPATPTDPPAPATAVVRTYDAPGGLPLGTVSLGYSVAVEGDSTACYQTPMDMYGERGHFANFETDGAGPVTVTVTVVATVTSAAVTPISHGITPSFTPGGHTVTFDVVEPGTYALIVNGNWQSPLYVYANPYAALPDPADFTYYYGPGYYNSTTPSGAALPTFWGALQVNAGESVYVHGGAYLKGKIFLGPANANGGATAANIHVSGYGVVDSTSSTATMGPGRPAQIGSVNGGGIEGVTFIGQKHWGCTIAESYNILLKHAKMLNYKMAAGDTPDGIDILGSRLVTYDHCFIRAADDCIAVKTWKSGFGPSPYWRGNVENIVVKDSVFHGGRGGNGFDIGYETFNNLADGTTAIIDPTTHVKIAFIRNITYQRCDFIRKTFDATINYRCAAIGIHATDDTPISNILYEDINFDYVADTDAWLWIGSGAWDSYTYGQRGPISGITLRRVNFRDGNPNPNEIHFEGGSATQKVTGVTFEDVYIKGSKVTAAASLSGKWTWSATNTNAPTFL